MSTWVVRIGLVVLVVGLYYAWLLVSRTPTRRGRVLKRLGLLAVPVLLMPLFATWYTYFSDEAWGRPPYFRRLVGLSAYADDTVAACKWPDSFWALEAQETRVFRLPATVRTSLISSGAMLAGYPRRAGYQEHHTMIDWQRAPVASEDAWLMPEVVAVIRDAQRGRCKPCDSTIEAMFIESIHRPSSWIAYAYHGKAAGPDSVSFYLLDVEAGLLYDVEGAT